MRFYFVKSHNAVALQVDGLIVAWLSCRPLFGRRFFLRGLHGSPVGDRS